MTTEIETRTTLETLIMAYYDPNKLKLRLSYKERAYTFFWQGKNVASRPPTVRQVLMNFHMSCSSDTSNYDDWCNQYGCDSEKISILKIYRTLKRKQAKIRRLFGYDYKQFMDFEFYVI